VTVGQGKKTFENPRKQVPQTGLSRSNGSGNVRQWKQIARGAEVHQVEIHSSTNNSDPVAFERNSSFAPGDVVGEMAVAAKQSRRSP